MSTELPVHVGADLDEAAGIAAGIVADALRAAIDARGRASVAFSGGSTPWPMLRALATGAAGELDWSRIAVLQVDERVAPSGSDDRNATHIVASLVRRAPVPKGQWYPIPVEEPDPAGAARRYERTVRETAGGEIDVVHLGIGDDGHTASLVPGDPVLGENDRLVAATGEYEGHRRVTLTYPALAAARSIVWLIVTASKGEMLRRLVAGDATIPAGRVLQDRAVVVTDEPAAAPLLGER